MTGPFFLLAASPPIGPGAPERWAIRGLAGGGEGRPEGLPLVASPAGTPRGRGDCWTLLVEGGCEPGMPGLSLCAAPCRDNIISFILLCISEVKLLARGGGGPGLRAAFTGPRGEDVEFMAGAEVPTGDRRVGGFGDVSEPSTLSG